MLDNTSTVFIDEDADGNAYAGDYDESIYEQYGPKNEVYLASGQVQLYLKLLTMAIIMSD